MFTPVTTRRRVKVTVVALKTLEELENRKKKSGKTVRLLYFTENAILIFRTETSLDGPISPSRSVRSNSQTSVSIIDRPSEEAYDMRTPPPPPLIHHSPVIPSHQQNPVMMPMQHVMHSPKPPLEIPAESHPRVPDPPNIELLNNNIPKNCTIVQAAVLKPYHEETKPFEMSDCYKYSSRFKKSPQKDISRNSGRVTPQTNLSQEFQENQFPVKVQQQYMQHR